MRSCGRAGCPRPIAPRAHIGALVAKIPHEGSSGQVAVMNGARGLTATWRGCLCFQRTPPQGGTVKRTFFLAAPTGRPGGGVQPMEREELVAHVRARVWENGPEPVLLQPQHQVGGAERLRPRLVYRGTPQVGRYEYIAEASARRRIQRVLWLLAASAVAPEPRRRRRTCRPPKTF